MKRYNTSKQPRKQRGAALLTALVMLVLMTLLGLSTLSTSTLEERMAANSQEVNRAFQAASTGLELAFNDNNAFNPDLTKDNDGTADDRYDENDTIGNYGADITYNSVFINATQPPRGSGWDSSFAFYHFNLSAHGSTKSGASSTVHAGAYQVGQAP